jgi:hypothetical protein
MRSMHPAFALARRKLVETRAEYDAFLSAEAEKIAVPLIGAPPPATAQPPAAASHFC